MCGRKRGTLSTWRNTCAFFVPVVGNSHCTCSDVHAAIKKEAANRRWPSAGRRRGQKRLAAAAKVELHVFGCFRTDRHPDLSQRCWSTSLATVDPVGFRPHLLAASRGSSLDQRDCTTLQVPTRTSLWFSLLPANTGPCDPRSESSTDSIPFAAALRFVRLTHRQTHVPRHLTKCPNSSTI